MGGSGFAYTRIAEDPGGDEDVWHLNCGGGCKVKLHRTAHVHTCSCI